MCIDQSKMRYYAALSRINQQAIEKVCIQGSFFGRRYVLAFFSG